MIVVISAAPVVDTAAAMEMLSRKYKLSIKEDPMREACLKYGFQTIYDMPYDLQKYVREKLIKDHINFLNHNDNLLLNYSIISWLADWMRWFWSSTPTESWAKTLDMASNCVQKYDRIYHLDDNVNRGYDGYIWLDGENSRQINGLIKYLYNELDVGDKIVYRLD